MTGIERAGQGLGEPAALRVDGVSYRYAGAPAPALDDVSFTVAPGSFTALLGANGAGKTTLFALITRLFAAGRGRIDICGIALEQAPSRALGRIGVVFQQSTLDLDLTVRQNLLYAASLHGLDGATARTRVIETLTALAMPERLDERVRRLNGGHRRRVELARALLHRPQVLVLDEPTVGLDVASRRAIVDQVHALCRDHGLAALWATHLIDEIADDDAVVLIHRGRILARGSAAALNRQTGQASLALSFRHLTESPA